MVACLDWFFVLIDSSLVSSSAAQLGFIVAGLRVMISGSLMSSNLHENEQ